MNVGGCWFICISPMVTLFYLKAKMGEIYQNLFSSMKAMLYQFPNLRFLPLTPKSDFILNAKVPATNKIFLDWVHNALGDPEKYPTRPVHSAV